MYLKSVNGKILFEGRFSSLRHGVELAVEERVDLRGINLRLANLAGARLDNARMTGGCFWGANLKGTNFAGAILENCDFRTANFLDTCLAEAVCRGADFSGAYFSRTIVRTADLADTRFSCPSLFNIDLVESKSLAGAVYNHLGEVECDLSSPPLIIRGLEKPLVFMDDSILVGTKIKKIPLRLAVLDSILAQTVPEKIMQL